MSLTRKHFTGIAQAMRDGIRRDESTETRRARQVVAMNLADYLATTNPSFNRDRFLDAAGFHDGGGDHS